MSTKLHDYDYHLPEELIGQEPREPRDHARLMLVDKTNKKIEKHQLIRSFFVFNISYHHWNEHRV